MNLPFSPGSFPGVCKQGPPAACPWTRSPPPLLPYTRLTSITSSFHQEGPLTPQLPETVPGCIQVPLLVHSAMKGGGVNLHGANLAPRYRPLILKSRVRIWAFLLEGRPCRAWPRALYCFCPPCSCQRINKTEPWPDYSNLH